MNATRSPSAKQIDFATAIAETLGIDLPEETTSEAYYDFIRENQDDFYETKREIRREQYRSGDVFYLNHSYGLDRGYCGDSSLNRNPKS